jgi:hypothetical protein
MVRPIPLWGPYILCVMEDLLFKLYLEVDGNFVVVGAGCGVLVGML